MTATTARRFLLWLLPILVGSGLLAGIAMWTTSPSDPMDPENSEAEGSRALVEVLRGQGVSVDIVRSADALTDAVGSARPATSIVLGNPTNLGSDAAAALREASARTAALVLLNPERPHLKALKLDADTAVFDWPSSQSSCDTDYLDAVDRIEGLETAYSVTPGRAGVLCFPSEGDDSQQALSASASASIPTPTSGGIVEVPAYADRPETILIGAPAAFTNRTITEADNAAIALRYLGTTKRLVWYHPGLSDLADAEPSGVGGFVPRWVVPTGWILLLTVVVVALVRGRRLGPLVREPLPVVVRAAETTEARGRLYHRAGDRSRAAAILRHATIARLRRRLDLDSRADVDTVVRATAAATGTPTHDIAALLAGPEPSKDADLLSLAQALSTLEEKAHRP